MSTRDILGPATPPRHHTHLIIPRLWQNFIEDTETEDSHIPQQSHPPGTPPTPVTREPPANHASKASRPGSASSARRSSGSSRSSSSSRSPTGSDCESVAERLQSADPALDWVYGVTSLHHELPSLPGGSHVSMTFSPPLDRPPTPSVATSAGISLHLVV